MNLMTDPLIRAIAPTASERMSLPAVYSALMRDEIDSFPALRHHQTHLWRSFLVQLGAMAISRLETNSLPETESDWRDALRALTPDFPDDEPWSLVVEDPVKPAFMQPPSSSAEAFSADFERNGKCKKTAVSPTELDILVNANNHDQKAKTGRSVSDADCWLTALVSLQTGAGYLGRGNYGISRMNGAYGSRSAFSLSPSLRFGAGVKRDIAASLQIRSAVAAEFSMNENSGIGLLWLEPWDGGKGETLELERLDPFYVEVCRRVRLRRDGEGGLFAALAPSQARRVSSVKGVCGDLWTPVERSSSPSAQPKALTLKRTSLSTARVIDLLDGEKWERPPLLFLTKEEERLLEAGPGSRRMFFVARGLVGGQGKTDGFMESVISFRSPAARVLFGSAFEERGALLSLLRDRESQAAAVSFSLLGSVRTFAENEAALAWADRVREEVGAGFFDAAQLEWEAETEEGKSAARREWLSATIESASRILEKAFKSLPVPSADGKWRSMATAEMVFQGSLRKRKPLLDYWDSMKEREIESA